MTRFKANELVVIGGGAFGMWTALSAIEQGAKVTLIDQHGIGHPRASSGGASRNIRAAYGADTFYTRLAMQAWTAWQEREAQFGLQLLYPTGALRAETSARLDDQCKVFAACGQPCDEISASEARRRWPLVHFDDGERLFYEPQSGVVLASEALRGAARRFSELGGLIVTGRVSLVTRGGGLRIELNGRVVEAERVVFAAGPWLPVLFPELIGPLMRVPRRELFFFATPSDDAQYGWKRMPNLSDDTGWTSSDIGGGLKVAPKMRNIPLDPDAEPGPPGEHFADTARAWLARRIPSLAGAPLISTYVGQLENTANEHFLIDRHPEHTRVVLAGGGSGHAFKFGPVLGPVLARFALNGDLPNDWRARFGLSSHRPVQLGEAG